MNLLHRRQWIGYLISVAGIVAVIIVYRRLIVQANSTTVALSFLLVVLAASSTSGLGPGILASLAGVLCFNFFFLPPVGTFTIHDPANWAALTAFLVTAVIASQLSAQAQSRALAAEQRGREIEKLFEMSRAIITIPETGSVGPSLTRQIVDTFEAAYCCILIREAEQVWQTIATSTKSAEFDQFARSESLMNELFIAGETRQLPYPPVKEQSKWQRSVFYSPLRLGVKSTGMLVMISDAMERSTVEAIAGLVALALERARFLRVISQTEALRQSNELKSALLASVSHDLRTPLTSISGAVDILLQQDIGWNKVSMREFLLMIGEDVGRLSRLVDNLLEMARIEAGEIHPQREWNSVGEMIQLVLERCASTVKQHQVETDLTADLALVRLDPTLIVEALCNVVENAAHYSPLGTTITLRAYIRDDQLCLEVTDQGPGIDAEERDRIFEKFYRGEQSRRSTRKGTGMGLAIARGIVKAHNGDVWCVNNPGGGARFIIKIPVECKQVSSALSAEEIL